MNLKGIPPIYTPEQLVDIAFRKASKEAKKVQAKNRGLRKKKAEERRIKESTKYITAYLTKLGKLKLKIEEVPLFYRELLEINSGVEKILRALDKVSWAKKNVLRLEQRSRRTIRMNKGNPVSLRKDFYGKTSSHLNKIKRDLEFLDGVIKDIKNFPTIKEGFTVVIAGMPNVGKSSLLKQLTTSTPEIKVYPFTTKSILVGYIQKRHNKVQMIDTPGILDRPIEKRNPIERRAVLAIKELADIILFVFDPTEICGFPIESQLELYSEIKEKFVKVQPVINKLDIASASSIKLVEERLDTPSLKCSAKEGVVSEISEFIYLAFQRQVNNPVLLLGNTSPR
jgi:nucleolar GTP-binding protein